MQKDEVKIKSILRDIRESREFRKSPEQKTIDRELRYAAEAQEKAKLEKEIESEKLRLREKYDEDVKTLMLRFNSNMEALRRRSREGDLNKEAKKRVARKYVKGYAPVLAKKANGVEFIRYLLDPTYKVKP